jgi:hypothetical protein
MRHDAWQSRSGDCVFNVEIAKEGSDDSADGSADDRATVADHMATPDAATAPIGCNNRPLLNECPESVSQTGETPSTDNATIRLSAMSSTTSRVLSNFGLRQTMTDSAHATINQ